MRLRRSVGERRLLCRCSCSLRYPTARGIPERVRLMLQIVGSTHFLITPAYSILGFDKFELETLSVQDERFMHMSYLLSIVTVNVN